MANLIINLRVENADTPRQAVEIAQEIWAMLNTRLKGTPHTVTGKVALLCPDCRNPMVIEGQEIVCPTCISEWERQWSLDDAIKRAAQGFTEQVLEGLIY